MPVLCGAGEFDRVNPPKTVASIAKRHREKGYFLQVDGAGHWPIGEPGWEKTARYVREWLTNVTVAA